jgi:ribosomal protein L11 methylase PrmA
MEVDHGSATDVITANLTGTLLARAAPKLLEIVRPGGALILGGLHIHECQDVKAAWPGATTVWERTDEGWVGLVMKKS